MLGGEPPTIMIVEAAALIDTENLAAHLIRILATISSS